MNVSVKTDVGVVRSENQDRASVFQNDDAIVAVLCDGMGGHMGGSHASEITIKTFEQEFKKNFPKINSSNYEKIDNWFQKTIVQSKKEMINFANKQEELLDMGTTITAAVITNKIIKIYNIGDSRTYVYNGLLHQITKDHNLRNYYINNLGYSEEQAATVKGATALVYALGPKKKSHIDVFQVQNNSKIKYVILTSDGIHDYISKPNFEQIISSNETLDAKTSVLIKQALKGKSADNLTAIIVEVEQW